MKGNKSAKPETSLLWRLSVDGLARDSFIFGTMHARDGRVHGFIQGVTPFLLSCDVLATEFPLLGQSLPGLPGDFPHEDWVPGLSRRQRKMLVKVMTRFDLGAPEQFQALPPIMLIQLLTAELLGKEAEHPLDLALALQAREAGLELSGVETFEEQLDILRQIPVSLQVKQLLDLAGHFSRFRKRLRTQVKRYLRQDIRQLAKDSRKDLKGMRRILLVDRNRIMALRMGIMARERPHFFAIGAAHLAGGKGVLRHLRRQGFRLTPITLANHAG